MARDVEPPVRERDAAPTRRGGRRDIPSLPVEPAETPRDRAPSEPADLRQGQPRRRDHERPRRGTLPDRRLLRREPPADPEA
uniref:hypothetical protein n=1 Tax=Nocardia sp. CC216A TaxID=3044158 RepID=UPI0027957A19